MGIVAAALAGVGSALASGFAAFSATLIGKIVVGAAIGALTSAVMGGDIMKGVLFGAVGGAVFGAISSFGGLGNMATSTVSSVGGGPAALAGGSAGADAASLAAAQASTQTVSSTVSSLGGSILKEFGGSLVKGLAGSFMKSQEFDALQDAKVAEIKARTEAEMALLQKQDEMGLFAAQKHVPQDVPYMEMERVRQETEREKLAEQRRQFDVNDAQRTTEWNQLQQEKASRQKLFQEFGDRGSSALRPDQPSEEAFVDNGSAFEARQEDNTGQPSALANFYQDTGEEEKTV